MKNLLKLAFVSLLVMGTSVFAQAAKESKEFKVFGNCGMCEKRIEKAASAVDGVSSADWDKKTKMISVIFDTEKTDLHKIHQAIAKVGHDTEMHKAKDEVYKKLPGCCLYDREVKESKKHDHDHGHKH